MTQLLAAIAGSPVTLRELAERLGSDERALAGMLQTLQRGGYIQPAEPQQGECHCGPCALKSLCRNADEPQLELWRLTARGQRRLEGERGNRA